MHVWDLRLYQRYYWRLQSPWMLRCMFRQKFTTFPTDRSYFIFSFKQPTQFFCPEYEGITIGRNVGSILSNAATCSWHPLYWRLWNAHNWNPPHYIHIQQSRCSEFWPFVIIRFNTVAVLPTRLLLRTSLAAQLSKAVFHANETRRSFSHSMNWRL